MKKIIVAHPGQQHSYRLAGALNKYNYLDKYITTVYDKNSSFVMWIVKRLLGKDNSKRAERRHSNEIEDAKVIQFSQFKGLFLLLVLRLDHTEGRILYNKLNQMISNSFGRKVARYAIKNKVDAVICYDSNAITCFKYLRDNAPNIIRIMDNSAPNRYGLYFEYQDNNRKYGVIDRQPTAFKRYLTDEKCAVLYKEEAYLSDYHIVASSFSARMLNNIGIPKEKIFIAPYGFNTHQVNKIRSDNKIVKFLFVGEMSAQKGIFDYISAAEKFCNIAEFHAVGGGKQNLDSGTQALIDKYLDYHGYLLQEELFELYNEMDVLVFPSLGDGFGFVVLEALSFGLPVICSENSVGQDIISEKENGLLFKAGNVEQLKSKIRWMIENKDEIRRMSQNAMKSVAPYTWGNYGLEVKRIMDIIVENNYVYK